MSQHIRILMVEDSANDAALIERELRRANLNCSIQRVHTENDLRQTLESMDPDVILGDYNLPGFDGIAALKIAQSVVPDTPYIFVSGSIGEERAVQTLREGATDYLLKDRLSRLPSAIIRAVDQGRERRLRRRAQEALQRMSHQNELILNSAAEAIIAVDPVGKTLVVNPSASRITGFSAEELLAAKSVHDLIHHTHTDGAPCSVSDCPIMKATRDGTPLNGQEVFWRKSGESFPADFSCSPIREYGEVTGSVITFQDITERKRLESRIQQEQRVASLGRVAATIAHEFNNVLMGIQPFAEVIRRNTQEEKLLKATSHILNSVARGTRVTQEILRFTQPAQPALQPVDLREWTQQLLPELQAMIGEKIRIDLDAPAEPVVVRCDSAQMQQVVSNLVLNARDAMTGRGTITVSIAPPSAESEMARLSVRDPGAGMIPEVLQNIFEPLFTTKRSGTGLGLAVAQQVVTRHGGSIQVESTPGQGSLFTILLPGSKEPALPKLESKKQTSATKSLLLVEDDADVAAGLVTLLEMERIRVEVVSLGAKVIDAIAGFNPDAVILDLTLPDMSGLGVYEEIAKRWPALPVIFSTGHGDETVLISQASNVGFLRKPYDLGTLLETLERVSTQRSKAIQ
jgi:PAS domain S-box-containing protein